MTGPRQHDREAAVGRVQAFLADLDRLDVEDLIRTALPAAGPELEAARRDAERIAAEAGLADVLADARETVRAAIVRRYDRGMYRPTMVGLQWGISEGPTSDRVRTMQAAFDGVTAAVVEPLAPARVVEALASPFELIDRGGEVDGSLPLSEATARALQARAGADGTSRTILAIAVVTVAAALLVAGLLPLALAWIAGVGILLAIGRRARR